MKTKASMLAAALVLVALAPTTALATGEYVAHAPIACVNNALVTSYNGRAYDPSGVTGSGTPEDPFVVAGWKFDTVAYATYPTMVVLNNCDNVNVVDNQFYGYLGYYPPCYAPSAPGFSTVGVDDVADYGILVKDSDNVLVNNNIVKAARLAGLKLVESSVTVTHNQFSANYGAGVLVDGGAVSMSDNLVAYNGYTVPRDRELREGPNESLPTGWGETFVNRHAAGMYAENGTQTTGSNNSFSNNVNNIVVDQQLDESTTVAFNVNGVELPLLRSVAQVESPFDVVGCSTTGPPGWVGAFDGNPYAEETFDENGQSQTSVEVAEARQASASAANAVPSGTPLDCTAGEGALDFRLNWWGGLQGPSFGEVQGAVETCLWLSVAPPGVQAAGLLHAQAPREERVANALVRSALAGDVAGVQRALGALLP